MEGYRDVCGKRYEYVYVGEEIVSHVFEIGNASLFSMLTTCHVMSFASD